MLLHTYVAIRQSKSKQHNCTQDNSFFNALIYSEARDKNKTALKFAFTVCGVKMTSALLFNLLSSSRMVTVAIVSRANMDIISKAVPKEADFKALLILQLVGVHDTHRETLYSVTSLNDQCTSRISINIVTVSTCRRKW